MTRIFLAAALLLAGLAAALAQQTVTRVGPITLGDCASFQSPNSIQDGGIPCGVGHFANPTASVGLTVVNGSATTSMRSDAAPPLSASVQSALTATVSQVLIGTGAFGFSSVVTVPIAQGGTGQATATLGFQALAPTPTRAGDIIFWNGSTWVTLAGNNSGTQTLTENSSGVPSWTSAGIGTFVAVRVQKFTASGTYTPSSGIQYAIIECIGGGGGGGGVSGTASNYFAAGGGGSGSYSRKYVSAATIGVSQTVTIGTAGTGGTAGASGSAGGDTSVGALCIGKGGSGGVFASAPQVPIGGAGGVAGTGDVTPPGNTGGNGFYNSLNTAIVSSSGFGGASAIGGGALGVYSATNVAGNAGGTNTGGGGSGASITGAGSANGGSGALGVVVVTEFTNQ